MDSPSAATIWQGVQASGLTGCLVFILYGGWKGIWVWGRQLDEMKNERDQWRSFALRGTAIADKAVGHLERARGVTPLLGPHDADQSP